MDPKKPRKAAKAPGRGKKLTSKRMADVKPLVSFPPDPCRKIY